jgi:hypothetical protein
MTRLFAIVALGVGLSLTTLPESQRAEGQTYYSTYGYSYASPYYYGDNVYYGTPHYSRPYYGNSNYGYGTTYYGTPVYWPYSAYGSPYGYGGYYGGPGVVVRSPSFSFGYSW